MRQLRYQVPHDPPHAPGGTLRHLPPVLDKNRTGGSGSRDINHNRACTVERGGNLRISDRGKIIIGAESKNRKEIKGKMLVRGRKIRRRI